MTVNSGLCVRSIPSLRIANELYLKRLIVGGFDGVYEFSRNFRNEGMDRTHNPEFTVMEIYVAYTDYKWMMEFTEQMLEHVALKAIGTTKVKVGDNEIDFKAPYPRVTMLDAIKEHTGIDISGMNEEQLREVCKELGVEQDETMGKGKLIDEIFGEKAEGKYIQPTFIIDYPIEMSPLTKRHRENPELTERFELMVNGKELANAYSELNDPVDQRERFEEQLRLSEKGDDEAMFIDQDFLRALEYGMPPTSGMGIGMDRLTMLLTGQSAIQEVLLFPIMRPEQKTGKDAAARYTAIGVPEEWVQLLQRLLIHGFCLRQLGGAMQIGAYLRDSLLQLHECISNIFLLLASIFCLLVRPLCPLLIPCHRDALLVHALQRFLMQALQQRKLFFGSSALLFLFG